MRPRCHVDPAERERAYAAWRERARAYEARRERMVRLGWISPSSS